MYSKHQHPSQNQHQHPSQSQNQNHYHGHHPAVVVHRGHDDGYHHDHIDDYRSHHDYHIPGDYRHPQVTHYRSSSWGARGTLIAALIFIPIVIVALIANTVTSAVSATSMATFGATATGSALALSTAATFGLGLLIAYGVIGLGCLYSSAKECYSSDRNVFDMLKSRVVNEDGLSFKGVMKSIGAVLWSPFLLVGGLAGMGVKVAVAVYQRPKSSKSSKEEVQQPITTSHEQMSSGLAASKDGQKVVVDKDLPPSQLLNLFSNALKGSSHESVVDSSLGLHSSALF